MPLSSGSPRVAPHPAVAAAALHGLIHKAFGGRTRRPRHFATGGDTGTATSATGPAVAPFAGPSNMQSQTAALSFVPAPTAADTTAANSGTPATPVSYTSSIPATAPSFGPVLAQTNSFGQPMSTPSNFLPTSAGIEQQMYDPNEFTNPLNSMTPSTATASTPPPSSAATSAPSQQVTIQGQPYNVVTANGETTYVPVNATEGPTLYANPIMPGTILPNGTTPQSAGVGGDILFALLSGLKKGGRVEKKQKMAGGGIPTSEAMDPWYTRAEERGMVHPEGLVKSFGAGRTDIHPIDVPAGSYVVPADVVSGQAEGNTIAGSGVIDRMMHSAPFGIEMGGGKHGSGPPRAPAAPKPVQEPESRGGAAKKKNSDATGEMVPIIVAGGEHIIYPQTIMQKFGDLKRGHAILDKWVLKSRKQNVDNIRKLKGPKK